MLHPAGCWIPSPRTCSLRANVHSCIEFCADGWWNGTWSAWEIGAGASGACALDAARAAWCWGQQAGAGGEVTAVPTPQAVPGGRRWWWLATGAGGAVCGIEYDWKYPELGENETLINPEAPGGHMYCWGVNRAGLLGGQHADLAYSLEPLRIDVPGMGVGNATAGIDGIAGWGGVSVGPSSACALRLGSDGAPLFCWGHSDRGQLGNGTAGPPGSVQATPRLVSNCDGCDYSSWTAVSVGDGFACGIDDARYISCWVRSAACMACLTLISVALLLLLYQLDACSHPLRPVFCLPGGQPQAAAGRQRFPGAVRHAHPAGHCGGGERHWPFCRIFHVWRLCRRGLRRDGLLRFDRHQPGRRRWAAVGLRPAQHAAPTGAASPQRARYTGIAPLCTRCCSVVLGRRVQCCKRHGPAARA